MMISPEAYYETDLKGKNPSEIMNCIHSLKKEISRCKKVLENPELYSKEFKILPQPDVRLDYARLNLERAKQALKDTGTACIPTEKEIAAEQFEKDLDGLQCLTFEIGGFCSGHRKFTVLLKDDDSISLDVKESRRHQSLNLETTKIPFTREEFMGMVKALHLDEWQKEYVNPRILDGTQWELILEFSDKKRKVRFYGSNKYPWCFDRLKKFFDCSKWTKEQKMQNQLYKENENDLIQWVDTSDKDGEWVFTFDGKQFYNMFRDYPHNMTKEEAEIFSKENPYWRNFFSDRFNE